MGDIETTAPKTAAWTRQKGETAKAYSAFLLYRDLPPDSRTIHEAIALYREKEGLPPTSTPCGRWPSTWKWKDRAAAFDAYMDAAEVETMRRRRIEAAKRHADQAMQVQETLMHPILKYRDKLLRILDGRTPDELDALPQEELLRLGIQTAKLLAEQQRSEREALGIAGQVRETEGAELTTIRGDILRRVLDDPGEVSRLEAVQFRVTEETRKLTTNGNRDIPGNRESGGNGESRGTGDAGDSGDVGDMGDASDDSTRGILPEPISPA